MFTVLCNYAEWPPVALLHHILVHVGGTTTSYPPLSKREGTAVFGFVCFASVLCDFNKRETAQSLESCIQWGTKGSAIQHFTYISLQLSVRSSHEQTS